MNYTLAINRLKMFDIFALAGVIAIIGLSLFFHATVQQMMIICGGVLWVIYSNLMSLWLESRRGK